MANRFEDLDAQLEALEALRENPDDAGSPNSFLIEVGNITREIAEIGNVVTLDDFEQEYADDEEGAEV